MSAIRDAIVDIEGEAATPPGHDRRRGVALVFALCLAVGSATFGRDGPDATAPVEPPRTIIYTRDGFGQCAVVTFPDRLAKEPLPFTNPPSVTLSGGTTEALPVVTSEPPLDRDGTIWMEGDSVANAGQTWVIRCLEGSTASWLISDRRVPSDPLREAGSRR
jgi:hypothetical protein